jgi:hypothetical protein
MTSQYVSLYGKLYFGVKGFSKIHAAATNNKHNTVRKTFNPLPPTQLRAHTLIQNIQKFQERSTIIYHQMDLSHASIKGNKPHTQRFKKTWF